MNVVWKAMIFCLLAGLGVQAGAEPVLLDRIVAVVDDNIVLQSEVGQKVRFELMSRGTDLRSLPQDQVQDLFNKMLENEIQRYLLLAKAKEDSIEVDNELIENLVRQEIRRLKDQNGVDVFAQELKKQGITEREVREEFRQQYRNSFLERRMYEALSQKVTVTPKEVENFQKNYRQGMSDQLSISHILIEPKPSEDRKTEARTRAAALLARVVKGEDFAELAKQHSEDPGSAAEGGDLGFFSQGTMVPEFEEVAFGLKPGEISDVVESPFGYHIIRMEEVAGAQVRARHILILLRANDADAEGAHKKALDLYKRIQAGEDFAELARQHSTHQESAVHGGRLGVFPVTNLPPAFADAIRALKPGGISLPVKSELGWHLVRVNDDLESLEEIAKQIRLQVLFREVLAETREKRYVDVRLEPQ